jgi:ADP-ribose pyrophosphatase YjhB (NUDIX family)
MKLLNKHIKNNKFIRTLCALPDIQKPHPMYTVHEHAHCGYCGFGQDMSMFPHRCIECDQTTYKNPVPVAVGLLPFQIDGQWGLLLTKRSIQPHIGGLCFPGGFVNWGESWKQAISREVLEETGIETDPDEFLLKDVHSTPDNRRVLLFGYSKKTRYPKDILNFKPTDESSELIIGTRGAKLCFSLHQSVFDDFLPKVSRE